LAKKIEFFFDFTLIGLFHRVVLSLTSHAFCKFYVNISGIRSFRCRYNQQQPKYKLHLRRFVVDLSYNMLLNKLSKKCATRVLQNESANNGKSSNNPQNVETVYVGPYEQLAIQLVVR